MEQISQFEVTHVNDDGRTTTRVVVSFSIIDGKVKSTIAFDPFLYEDTYSVAIALADVYSMSKHVIDGNPQTDQEIDELVRKWSGDKKTKSVDWTFEEFYGGRKSP